jgi:hypothetical protein
MFSNTAYEAMYQYLGLALHSKFIEIITSQKIFLGAIVIIFGALFFTTSVEFFSRYMPGVLVRRRQVPYQSMSGSSSAYSSGSHFLRSKQQHRLNDLTENPGVATPI